MFPTSGWVGQTLQTALSEPPQMTLTFYSYGILLKKRLADGTFTEHPVDAAHIAQALSAKVTFGDTIGDRYFSGWAFFFSVKRCSTSPQSKMTSCSSHSPPRSQTGQSSG